MLKNIKLTNMKTSRRIFPRLVYKGREDIVFTYIFFHLFKLMLSATKRHLPRAFASNWTTTRAFGVCLFRDWNLCFCRGLDCTELPLQQNLIYGPSPTAFLEQSLRVIWGAISPVLILPHVKLTSQFSQCVIIYRVHEWKWAMCFRKLPKRWLSGLFQRRILCLKLFFIA